MNYRLITALIVLFLAGCGLSSDFDLEKKFSYYFRILNTSKEGAEITKARQEVEEIYHALEQENSVHSYDFNYLLNLYRSAEIAHNEDNPEGMKRLIRYFLHPANNARMLNKYQRAKQPQHFISKIHMSDLDAAFDICDKKVYTIGLNKYYGEDLVNAWQAVKKFSDRGLAIKKMGKVLEKGLCFGVCTKANELFCEDPSRSAESIIKDIDENFSQTLALQAQHHMSIKVLQNQRSLEIARASKAALTQALMTGQLVGFKLRSEVKRFIGALLDKAKNEDGDFVARVLFTGDNAGHAVAIQMPKGAREYRLIDNNVGVLSFDNQEEFLEAFAKYRLPYYVGHSMVAIKILADYCQ